MAEIDVWTELIEEARQGLAELRVDDLEELAQRAQAFEEINRSQRRDPARVAGDAKTTPMSKQGPGGAELRGLAARHRVLGDLLESTYRNLEVLRRLRGGAQDGRGDMRWVR